MPEYENFAIQRNGIAIGIRHLPNRKRPCLYITYDKDIEWITPMAWFDSDERAEDFKKIVKTFFDGMLQEQKGE